MTIAMPAGSRRSSRGFTLVELMVAVTIVAILTAIAYPSYRNYVISGQLQSATTGLSTMAANMERYYQDNRTYTPANTFNPPCKQAVVYGTFTVSCLTDPTANPDAYTLTAVGSGSTAGFTFTLDQAGTQKSTATARGWSNCNTSWEVKPGICP